MRWLDLGGVVVARPREVRCGMGGRWQLGGCVGRLGGAGDLHHQALRALGNRLVGILHGCLRHHTTYNEHTAWAHRQTAQAA